MIEDLISFVLVLFIRTFEVGLWSLGLYVFVVLVEIFAVTVLVLVHRFM